MSLHQHPGYCSPDEHDALTGSNAEPDAPEALHAKDGGGWPLPEWMAPKAPAAVVEVKNGWAVVCSWCDGGEHPAAHWALDRGLRVTHGICSACAEKHFGLLLK